MSSHGTPVSGPTSQPAVLPTGKPKERPENNNGRATDLTSAATTNTTKHEPGCFAKCVERVSPQRETAEKVSLHVLFAALLIAGTATLFVYCPQANVITASAAGSVGVIALVSFAGSKVRAHCQKDPKVAAANDGKSTTNV